MIDNEDEISLRRQCQLLGLDRTGLYYEPVEPDGVQIALGHRLDELYTAHPFYGVRRMTEALRRRGLPVNPKRVFGRSNRFFAFAKNLTLGTLLALRQLGESMSPSL